MIEMVYRGTSKDEVLLVQGLCNLFNLSNT